MTVIEYLKQNKEVISASALEKLLKIPSTTISKAINGREMPLKHEQTIYKYIRKNLIVDAVFEPKLIIKGSDIVEDINQYELMMEIDEKLRRAVPTKNTYTHKKTGEVVQINYTKGAFRFI